MHTIEDITILNCYIWNINVLSYIIQGTTLKSRANYILNIYMHQFINFILWILNEYKNVNKIFFENLTDFTASVFSMSGVLAFMKGDSHCSNNSSKNCRQERMSSSSNLFLGSSSFIWIIRASESSLSESSWTSVETSRVLMVLAEIWKKAQF